MIMIISGRFERYLEFVKVMKQVYALPHSESSQQLRMLLDIRRDYFACAPAARISVTSQVALRNMSGHLNELFEGKVTVVNLDLTRAVFEDAYRKLQQKHDVFKKNYKPSMTLQTLLCLLS